MTPATSLTHEHLLSILNTEVKKSPGIEHFRLLDVGCGNGALLAYILANLPKLQSGVQLEVHGFDVADHGVQPVDYFANALKYLRTQHPEVPWEDRLCLISVRDRWPYADEYFDAIISNQVLEHVNDHDLLFSEIRRTLRPGGFSAHLFPLENYVLEGHLLLPWVHRIKNHDLMISYIRLLSRLGLGKYPRFHRESNVEITDFSIRHADFVHYFTNYLTMTEALDLAYRHRLRGSFRYTGEWYGRKIASLLHRPRTYEYAIRRSGFRDALSVFLWKYVSCITLFLEKKETYTTGSTNPGPNETT